MQGARAFRECPTIRTARLTLRAPQPSDAAAWARMLDHPEVRAGLHLGERRSQDVAWSEMTTFAGQWALFGTGNWVLEHRETGAFVGRAGLHDPVREAWPGLEVGWTLAHEHWGQGYATEAGAAAIDHAFTVLDRSEVFSTILPTNTASQAVARRLGFTWIEDRPMPILKNNAIGIWHLARADQTNGT